MNSFLMWLFISLLCHLFCLKTVKSVCYEYYVGEVPAMKGRIQDFALIQKSSVPTLEKCSEICALDTSCVTFFYNSNTGDCQTHSIFHTPHPTDQLDNNWRYYQIYSENCHRKYGFLLNRNENICYSLSSVKKTWDEAKNECNNRGLRLMKIKNKRVQDHLEMILSRYPGVRFFIGLRSKDENNQWNLITSNEYEPLDTNQWVWSDGEKLRGFSDWSPFQVVTTGESCVFVDIAQSPGWINVNCSSTTEFICENIL